MRSYIAGVCLSMAMASAWSQDNQAAKANEVWNTGNRLEALPYYEVLAKDFPNEWLYSERLAVALQVTAEQTDDPKRQKALLTRMRDAAAQAVKDGDPNYFVQLMASTNPDAGVQKGPQSPAGKLFQDAEKAFGTGDYAKAVDGYSQAFDLDPKFYEAALYAGDAAYENKDLPTAAKWFARAIAIDPARETAYRYWGDAMLKYGSDPEASKDKFIDAIVAEPYNKLAWQGIHNWADRQRAVLMAPKIDRPAPPQRDQKNPKNITINLDPSVKGDSGAVWLSYQMERSLWVSEKFSKEFPSEKNYRHSLREEDSAITLALTVAGELKSKPEKLDESLRNLLELHKAGMLDCWILINGADQGIAQDYDAYRKEHRQLLHEYIARFVVHGGVTPPK